MSTDAIKQAISELRQEDEALAEQERKTARRRAQISTALSSLLALETDEPLDFKGTLADAIRHALIESPVTMTAPDVRDALRLLGYDITKHTNVLASIHNALKRFEQVGDAKAYTKNGQTAYEWLGRSKPPVLEITTTPKGSATTGEAMGAVLGSPGTIKVGQAMAAALGVTQDNAKNINEALAQQLRHYDSAAKSFSSHVGRLDLQDALSNAELVAKSMKGIMDNTTTRQLEDISRQLKWLK